MAIYRKKMRITPQFVSVPNLASSLRCHEKAGSDRNKERLTTQTNKKGPASLIYGSM